MTDTIPEGPRAPTPTPSLKRRSWLRISGFGICTGLLFFAASLTPSLLPRDAVMQGLLGGTLFAFGYAFTGTAIALWRWFELPEPRARAAITLSVVLALAGLGVAFASLSQAAAWQNSIRTLMGLPEVETTHPLKVGLIALATALVLIVCGYIVLALVPLVRARLPSRLPQRVANAIGIVVAVVVVWGIVEGLLVRYTMRILDQSYAALDSLMEPEFEAPSEAWRVGSAASEIEWHDLGRDGRRFVARAPTAAEIGDFWQAPAQEPLRVYVGLAARDDPATRATLALEELKRIGGFERDVLVVAVPTGTGFMEEAAIAPLEYLHKGSVATVALQYSYLQSPFSLIFEPGYGAETARALLRTVYDHWTSLDADQRPRLYLQGVSLGALSSERSVRLYEVLGDPINGAVWSGPPFPSPNHRAATQEREAGSPAWLPRLDNGSFARFTRDGSNLHEGAPWGPMRVVYMQHPSDPIVFFDLAMLWRAPDWMTGERGPDVSSEMRWYPVVTALQVAADMALSNTAPVGHGHQYSAHTYIDSWMAVTEPPVTDEDVARLKALFADGKTRGPMPPAEDTP